jgi:hypothetical protein
LRRLFRVAKLGPLGEKGAVCWKHPIPFLFCGR